MLDVLITAILGLIMFSIGLSLRYRHFVLLFSQPKSLLTGLFLQLISLPIIAYACCTLLDLPAAFATGVMVLAACPGGLTSNFVSFLLRADVALSVSLTICNSTLSMLTVPLIVNFALDNFLTASHASDLPLLATALRIFAIVLVPVIAGMLFRRRRPKASEKLQPKFRWLGIILLGLVFAIKLFAPASAGGSELLLSEVAIILPASLLINICALLSGRIIGRLLGFGRNTQLTLGVEAGIQNTSLAFLIATTLLANEQIVKPALVYAMFTFFTALAYGLWVKPGMWKILRKEWRTLRFTE